MSATEAYFARVAPLLGRGLSGCRLACAQLGLTGRVLELLVSCRLQRLMIADPPQRVAWPLPLLCRGVGPGPAGEADLDLLRRFLTWKNPALGLRWGDAGPADAHLGGELLPREAQPWLRWDRSGRALTLGVPRGSLWGWLELSHAAARQLRDVLLGRQAWPDGVQHLGAPAWPFAVSEVPGQAASWGAGPGAGAHVMVIGCGSVGSEAVRLLAPAVARWTLVDPGSVSVFNLVRQWFGLDEVGRPKVEALAARLAPGAARAVRAAVEADGPALEALLDAARPDLVLLSTGTADHGAIAAALWRRGIPYVAACAYAQARYYEVSCAIPAEATPCLHCFRGALYRGAERLPPLPDEVAAFLYREVDPAERDRLYTDLVAEPASAIETGRVAEVAAMLCWEVLSPRPRRGQWLRRMLEAETTCLLGGNTVERLPDGGVAYGVERAGQVLRLGVEDVVGAEAERVCSVCGRRLRVAHRLELPEAEDALVDRALLG